MAKHCNFTLPILQSLCFIFLEFLAAGFFQHDCTGFGVSIRYKGQKFLLVLLHTWIPCKGVHDMSICIRFMRQ